jgi:hypothetical protein
MSVTVLYPPDSIGAKVQSFLYFPRAEDLLEVLEEVRRVFSNSNGLPSDLKIRIIAVGDVVKVGDRFFVMTSDAFRFLPAESADNWMRRTSVERMLGSGHLARVSSGLMKKVGI